jgi:hypothetical protein
MPTAHGQTTVEIEDFGLRSERCNGLNCGFVEPMTGIEPAYSAWEVFSTPERVSDKRWSAG